MTNHMLDRFIYPELNILLWDNHSRFITRKQAFHIYETRYHFVDEKFLTKDEKELIQELADEFGNGFLLTK